MTDAGLGWRRISRGILMLGFGIFLLLTTTGRLPWSFWLAAGTYWPVILVGLGIRIIFEKSRAPWAILLSPLLILSTMAYAAWSGGAWPAPELAPFQVGRESDLDEWTLAGGLGFADLEVRAAPTAEGILLSGQAPAGRGGPASLKRSGRSGRVRLGRDARDRIIFHSVPRRMRPWEIEIAQDLPVSVDLALGFCRGNLALAEAAVKRIEIDGGFNDLTIRLGVPTESTRIDFEGAFNRIELIVPPQTPVSVSTDGLLNLVDGREGARRLEGPGYRLAVDGAFNSFSVTSP